MIVQMKPEEINVFWQSNNQTTWEYVLGKYMSRVKWRNRELENELENEFNKVKCLDDIKKFKDVKNWYEFMLEKYFRWKFTDGRIYAGRKTEFEIKYASNQVCLENMIEAILQESNQADAQTMIALTREIDGLAVPAGSGFLALLLPKLYGTVDRYIVENIKVIEPFKNHPLIKYIKLTAIDNTDFESLTKIFRNKADELNKKFSTNDWTPRKIDKVLWAIRQPRKPRISKYHP
ncbi:MAG: hypothetical protein ACR2NY_06690 [Alphaproteobacteria bacterium]